MKLKFPAYVFAFMFLICSCSSTQDSEDDIAMEPEPKDYAPVINSLTADVSGKYSGDLITVTADVTDTDNDIISYQWTVTDGSYEEVSNTNINWSSPLGGDNQTISLTVKDSKDNEASRSLNISLDSRPETFQQFLAASYHRTFSATNLEVIDDFIFIYSSETNGNGTSFRLKKLDDEGNEIWTKTFDEFPGDPREIGRLFKTPDNNLMLGIDGATIKVNTDGEVLWSYPSHNIYNYTETENGNYFFIGSINDGEWKPSYHVISPSGQLISEGIIQSGYPATPFDIAEGPMEGTYFVLAQVSNPDHPEHASEVLHINSSGEVLNTFGFMDTSRTNGRIFKEPQGLYTVFLKSFVSFGEQITRTNFTSTGEIIDSDTYSFDDNNEGIDFEQLGAGGYLIAGSFGPSSQSQKSIIFNIGPTGEIGWDIEFGQNTDKMDFASGITELPDGKILVSGSTFDPDLSGNNIKVYVHKYNADGSL